MYVSQKFATPQEFEAWLNNNEHPNKTALDSVTGAKLTEWDTKACKISIANGKIQLKCKDNNVIAEAPLSNAVDGSTIGCSGGCLIVTGVKNQNGGIVKLWLGTTEAYNKITVKDTNNTIYVKTDDNTIATINASLKGLSDRATALENRATALEGKVTSLEGTAGTHSKEIGSLETRATELESRATAIEKGKSDTGHKHTKSEITDFPTSMPASDVYDWAKKSTKPTYTASEVGSYSKSEIDTRLSPIETWKTEMSNGSIALGKAEVATRLATNSTTINMSSGTASNVTLNANRVYIFRVHPTNGPSEMWDTLILFPSSSAGYTYSTVGSHCRLTYNGNSKTLTAHSANATGSSAGLDHCVYREI